MCKSFGPVWVRRSTYSLFIYLSTINTPHHIHCKHSSMHWTVSLPIQQYTHSPLCPATKYTQPPIHLSTNTPIHPSTKYTHPPIHPSTNTHISGHTDLQTLQLHPSPSPHRSPEKRWCTKTSVSRCIPPNSNMLVGCKMLNWINTKV